MSLAEHNKLNLRITKNPCQFPLQYGHSKCGLRSDSGHLCSKHSTDENKQLFEEFQALIKQGYPVEQAIIMVGLT